MWPIAGAFSIVEGPYFRLMCDDVKPTWRVLFSCRKRFSRLRGFKTDRAVKVAKQVRF